MESERVHCNTELIDMYYSKLERILKTYRIPSAFIINIDEAGYSEWVDAGKIKVIVPSSCISDEINIPLKR